MKKLLLLIPVVLTLLTNAVYAQGTWTQRASFGGGNVTEARAFSIGNFGYIGAATPDLWEYDPVLDTWTQKATFIGQTRLSAAGFSIGNKGYFGTGGGLTDFYEYDQPTNTWTQKANFGGAGREGAVGVAVSGKGYIGTGGNYLSDWWEYDPVADTWTQKANLAGPGRYHAGAFAVNDKGYVCTGFNGSFYNDLWEYDPVLNTWTSKAPLPGTTRDRPVGMAANGKGYIVSGWTGSMALNDAFEYDPATDTWIQIPAMPGAPRYNSCGFGISNKIYIGTGFANGSVSDFWEYGPDCSSIATAQSSSCYTTCDGSATVTSPDPAAITSLIWSTGSTAMSITSLCPGTYTVTVTDTSGCVSMTDITVFSPPQISATTVLTLPSCFGAVDGSICASPTGGNPPYTSYLWSGGETTLCIQPVGAGTYTLTITDSAGCTGTVPVTLSQPGPITLTINHNDASCSTCADGTASAGLSGGTGPYSYLWSNGATMAFIVGLLPGTYTCCATDANGCTGCDSVVVSFSSGADETSIQDLIVISPNPFTHHFSINIEMFNGIINDVIIYDVAGRIKELPYSITGKNLNIEAGKLEKGIYFIELISGEHRTVNKILKM